MAPRAPKVTTAGDALGCVRSGNRVYIHPGCATPEPLVQALAARAAELTNVEVVHLLTFGQADYIRPEMEGRFRHTAFFIGANVREAVNAGRADFVPIFLSEIERLFSTGAMPIDVALIQVSPPDEHGFCSLGVGVDTTLTAAKCARTVVAEVNEQMPRTWGDSFLHTSQIDYLVETNRPLLELPRHPMTELHRAIGRNIADLIEDGATLQLGIGGIPDAVLLYLREKNDLGIHTEMFSDGIMELVKAGIITCERKTLHPHKIIASFVLGSRALFDFIDNNPLIELHPVYYTNDPFVIAQNEKMVAINSALQVDLTGQVCSDSIGRTFYSGFGGQTDFIRGAAHAKGGKPIIALPATAKDGSVSRIVPVLDSGAGVVDTRADVHYVVTEYGVAYLFGLSVRERARALIRIAHPKFREELAEWAMRAHILPAREAVSLEAAA
ncbi:MAG: acetyl-CoA hydrolase/transferase family protein [Acidobacteria bacterium]|nr:acetyl-CoA hydrolase/transferase family protein [Acidobacteriota bacterium]